MVCSVNRGMKNMRMRGIFAMGLMIFFGHGAMAAGASGETDEARAGETMERIVILGDSLTAGYGLLPEEAYPAVLETLLRERGRAVEVVNAGLSGDTTAGGLRRLDWVLGKEVDTLVLALGSNDALRGLSVESAMENLRKMIGKARERYPDIRILLAGMRAPPNMGEAYQESFDAIYPDLAEATEVELVPFLLEGVAAGESLNQADGMHPNAAGQRKIARLLLPYFE